MSDRYVEVSALAAWYGAQVPSEQQARKLLDAAADEVEAELAHAGRDLATDIGSGRLSWIAFESVVCDLACSALRNPAGARSGSTTHTEGPFTTTNTFTLAAHARGDMGLTERHRRRLGLAAGNAHTIRPGRAR